MTTSVLLRRLTSRIEDFYKSQERVYPPLNWKWCALVILAVVCVLFARCPSAFLRPGMWCEDGRIFFLGAWNDGWRSLFIPYNKYLHLLTRAFALIGVHISADWIPEIYFLSWLFVLVCLEAFILRVSWLSNVERILFAFSVVLAPHRGETLYNLTNMHWYLSLGFFFLLSAPAVRSWRAAFAMSSYAVVAGLTDPSVIIFLPWLFMRWLVIGRGNPQEKLICASVILVAAIQMLFLHYTSATGYPPATKAVVAQVGDYAPVEFPRLVNMALSFFFYPFVVFYTGMTPWLFRFLHTPGGIFAGVVMLVALFSVLACVFRNLQPPDRTAVLLWFACACSIIVLQGAGHLSRKIHGYVPLRADRYFLVPYVIFCFTLVRLFARSSGRAMRNFSVCATVVALTATTIPRFSIPEKPDVGWRGRMKSYRTRGRATFIDNSQRGDGRWEFELDSCQGGAKR